MTVYLRRRPLLLRSVVHTNIPLRLPLRNVIRKSSIHRRSTAACVPLVPAKAREGAGARLRRRRCTVAAVVPLVPDKARGGAWGWLLLRRCTVAAVVPLVPDKAREGAWGWLLLQRQCCTVAAAVASYERFRTITMTTTVLRRGARGIIAGAACLLLRRQCCTVAAAVVSNERFRTITMTATVLRRRTRDIIGGATAATAV